MAKRRRRKKRDTTGIILKLIIVLLILAIAGLLVWVVFHDRDLRSGVSALKRQKYEEAITCFDASIESGENIAESYRGKGIALFELGKYKEASEALIKSVDKGAAPNAQTSNMIAQSLIEQGDYAGSIEWLKDGLSHDDASSKLTRQMRYHLVVAYEKGAQWDLALENAQSYMADYPDDQDMKRELKFLETR